jgi:hypothetical protein
VAKGTVVISDFGRATVSQRTRASGAQTHTIEIKSAPVAVVVDAAMLGLPVATALADTITAQIEDIGEPAKDSTIKARKVEARAFVAGEPWAVKRYSGGRTGATPPNIHSTRMFNNSGRLARSIAVRATKDGVYIVNCAANRLNPADFKGGEMGPAYQHMVSELVRLVPAMSAPMAQGKVIDMQQRVARGMHIKGRMGEKGSAVAARAATVGSGWGVARDLARLVEGLVA